MALLTRAFFILLFWEVGGGGGGGGGLTPSINIIMLTQFFFLNVAHLIATYVKLHFYIMDGLIPDSSCPSNKTCDITFRGMDNHQYSWVELP